MIHETWGRVSNIGAGPTQCAGGYVERNVSQHVRQAIFGFQQVVCSLYVGLACGQGCICPGYESQVGAYKQERDSIDSVSWSWFLAG